MKNENSHNNIKGNYNIIGNNNTIIKTDKIIHRNTTKIIYDEEKFLSPKQQYKIREKVSEICEIMEKTSPYIKPYPFVWSSLKKKFKVASYHQIQNQDFNKAIKYLNSIYIKETNKLLSIKPLEYKKITIKKIYTMWNKIANKEDIYQFVLKKLSKKVTSLNALSANDINVLYQRVYYQYKKLK